MAKSSGKTPTKTAAEIENLQAVSAKHLAEAEFFRAQTRREEANAKVAELGLIETQREHEFLMASSGLNRTYDFTGAVGGFSSDAAIQTIVRWARISKEPITIVFNSPGGGVIDGFALYDSILSVRERGIKVDVVARGMAASMAAVLLQAGTTRTAATNSWILIHEISTRMGGALAQIKDDVKFTEELNDRLFDILAERAKVSRKKLQTMAHRKDVWMSAEDCLKWGLVDAVGYR